MSRQTAAPKQEQNKIPRPPERPLPPYMRFSKKIWTKVRIENPDIQLWEVSRKVGQQWAELTESERAVYQDEFENDRVEYEKQVRSYNQAYSQYISAKTKAVKDLIEKGASGGTSLSRKGPPEQNLSGVVIQPVDDDEPLEMTSKRLSQIRYDRNNRLMLELFSTAYLPDQRSMVPKQRIEHLRKQGGTLEQHQNKLNDELSRLTESFNQRKRSIASSAEAFSDSLKKLCEEKPQIEQDYEKKLAEYQQKILKSYDEYKKRVQTRFEAEKRETPILSSLISGPSSSTETNCSHKDEKNLSNKCD